MSENEKDENSSIKSKENVEQNDESVDKNTDDIIEIKKSQSVDYQQKIDELNGLLEKEKGNTLRWMADYQTLERNTPDEINKFGDKIILDFLTVYEDFIRAKGVYEKDGTNVDGLNAIIKNMKSILDKYGVKPIETKGQKVDSRLHEAIDYTNDSNLEEDMIVKEIAKGYIIRDKVLKCS